MSRSNGGARAAAFITRNTNRAMQRIFTASHTNATSPSSSKLPPAVSEALFLGTLAHYSKTNLCARWMISSTGLSRHLRASSISTLEGR
jgi:hypothetical protein